MSETRRGTVIEGTGGVWHVRTASGESVEASLRGRLKKSNAGRRADGTLRRDTVRSALETVKLAVGDDVVLEPGERGDAWAITEILPRRSVLARRRPGGGYGERILVANLDQVVVVFAAASPEPHPRLVDRFLVIAEGNALPARLVINKIELVNEAALRATFAPYERAGYPVHYVSARQRIGLDALRDALWGGISALTGPSGVGKSSLINALFPGTALRVGEISESVQKGRHTTVGALLTPLPPRPNVTESADATAAYVVDTPGLREVGMWGLPARELDSLFPEFRPYLGNCRFADCAHTHEPECAVRAAIEQGAVSAERHDSYLKLRDELTELETQFR